MSNNPSNGQFQAVTGPRGPVLQDIPRDEINEVMKSVGEGLVRVQRRNDKGHLSYCERRLRKLDELFTIEDFLREQYGGGRYKVDTFAANDMTKYLVPSFEIHIEGMSKPINRQLPVQYTMHGTAIVQTTQGPVEVPANVAQQMQAQAGTPQPLGYPQQAQGAPQFVPTDPSAATNLGAGTVNHFANMNPLLQAAHSLAGVPGAPHVVYPHPQPGSATMAADQALAQQVEILRAEAEKDRAEAKALAVKLEERLQREQEENKRLKEENDRREREAEKALHKAELENLKALMLARDSKKEEPQIDYSKMIGALAPVLVAYIGSGKDNAQLAMNQQVEAQKNQMQMLQATMQMISANNTKSSDADKMLAPVLLKMLDQKSPEAQGQLISTMAENSMSQMAMMAQFVQAMASQNGDSAPWWLPMVQNGIQGAMDMIGGIMAVRDKGGAQQFQQAQQRALPPGMQAPAPQTMDASLVTPAPVQGPSGSTTPSETYTTMDTAPTNGGNGAPTNGASNGASAPAPKPESGPNPDVVTKMVMARLPEDMRRPEWQKLIHAIHSQEPPADVAGMFVALLDHLNRFDLIPADLADVIAHPRDLLTPLLAQLPINSYAPDYGISVLESTVRAIDEYRAELEAQNQPEQPEQDVVDTEAVAVS